MLPTRTATSKCVAQNGYALIAALMAVLLLLSVGIMAFMLSCKDVIISTRMVNEKKAFSAAEEGLHELVYNVKPSPLEQKAIDTKNAADSDCQYSATKPTPPKDPYYYGPGNDPRKALILYTSDITGKHKGSGASVGFRAEVGYGPVDVTTNY
jgi:hypothetical protein